MPRICILSQYFPPEMGAPQARLSELGERLIDAGWDVEVLTALPNYPTGHVFPAYANRGAVVETIGRIRTVRVPLYTAKTGFVKRLGCYFSFVASAIWHGPRFCKRPDLLFAESPPLFIGLAMRALARVWKCSTVLNVSDLWPESAVRMGILEPGGLSTRAAERLEQSMYESAGGITGQSTEIIDFVRQRCPTARTAVITNGVDPTRFGREKADGAARALLGNEPGPVFVFAGLLGYAQGLDQILDIARAMPASSPGRFLIVGEGPQREHLQQRVRDESIARVKIVAAQPRERIPALLAACDVALISLGTALPGAVPSKIYEAMASSLPILLIADGEPARRVLDAECGLAISPNTIDAAVDAVQRLAGDANLRERLGSNGRRAAETTYNRDRIGHVLDDFLRSVLASRD